MAPKIGKTNKKIMRFKPSGYRYEEIPVEKETEHAVIGKTKANEEIRVFKHGPAWSGEKDTVFLAIDGSPVTAVLNSEGEYETISISNFLRELWGDKAVDTLPPVLREKLTTQWATQFTVYPSEVDQEAEKTLDALKANEFLYESNLKQAEEWGKFTEEKSKMETIIDFLLKAALGGFFMYFLVKQGII